MLYFQPPTGDGELREQKNLSTADWDRLILLSADCDCTHCARRRVVGPGFRKLARAAERSEGCSFWCGIRGWIPVDGVAGKGTNSPPQEIKREPILGSALPKVRNPFRVDEKRGEVAPGKEEDDDDEEPVRKRPRREGARRATAVRELEEDDDDVPEAEVPATERARRATATRNTKTRSWKTSRLRSDSVRPNLEDDKAAIKLEGDASNHSLRARANNPDLLGISKANSDIISAKGALHLARFLRVKRTGTQAGKVKRETIKVEEKDSRFVPGPQIRQANALATAPRQTNVLSIPPFSDANKMIKAQSKKVKTEVKKEKSPKVKAENANLYTTLCRRLFDLEKQEKDDRARVQSGHKMMEEDEMKRRHKKSIQAISAAVLKKTETTFDNLRLEVTNYSGPSEGAYRALVENLQKADAARQREQDKFLQLAESAHDFLARERTAKTLESYQNGLEKTTRELQEVRMQLKKLSGYKS